MRLADVIDTRLHEILSEWEAFAAPRMPAGSKRDRWPSSVLPLWTQAEAASDFAFAAQDVTRFKEAAKPRKPRRSSLLWRSREVLLSRGGRRRKPEGSRRQGSEIALRDAHVRRHHPVRVIVSLFHDYAGSIPTGAVPPPVR